MQAKTNLNNTQRRMLEKIYATRLDKKISEYKSARASEREAVIADIVAAASKKYKALIEAGKKYRALYVAAANDMKADQVSMREGSITGEPKLALASWFAYDSEKPKALHDFDNTTNDTLRKLSEMKDEVSLRIYGSELSYTDIDKEINELLKGVL